MTKFSAPFLMATAIVALAGCSDNTATATTTTTPTADAIVLSAAPTAIKTDNTSKTTLTATVTAANVVLSGVTVTFATTTGNLSTGTATTDANGQATVTLTSGAGDFSNRTAIVTATAAGRTASIPIQINGSTLTLTASTTTVQIGTVPGTIPVTAAAFDASGQGKNNQTIRFSVGATSTGTATLSATTLTTGVDGSTATVTLTPTAPGTVVLTAEWLDVSGEVSVIVNKGITVTAASGVAFAITTPATDPVSLATGAAQPLTVSVPTTIGATNVASVRINSTGGTWVGVTQLTTASASISQIPVSNAVAANYTASNSSGAVTVQVDALGTVSGVADTVLSSLTRTFVVSALASELTTTKCCLDLQASKSTIAPSSGSTTSTATLTATVRVSSGGNSVGNAAVLFELLGTTGTGESISPAVTYTDGTGIATATFNAGSQSTLGSVYARARVVGQTCTGLMPDPVATETNLLCKATPLIVNATAVSMSINFGTGISDYDTTLYSLAGTVTVVDANGTPSPGATVTLTVFPFEYRNGTISEVAVFNSKGDLIGYTCVPPATSFVANEDVNRNAFLDPGEDTGVDALGNPIAQTAPQSAALAISDNNMISPNAAAGGGISAIVTTNSSGVADFTLLYPKSSAMFIKDEVTARLGVNGTEGSARTFKELPFTIADSFGSTPGSCKLQRTATY